MRMLLFWNMPLRFMLEGYLELTIDCLINLKPLLQGKMSLFEDVHSSFSNLFSVGFSILLIAYPFIIFFKMSAVTEESLANDESLRKHVGEMYDGVRIKDKSGVSYNFIFTLRRFVYAAILVFLNHVPWLQISLI
mmetsp:Transcript_30102/g.45993  ORF Transcript_30102/g.45993 Transcript_30102/m.45993 type:complete len:135 (-) Transcript_30102:1414-1818(-)